jgi:uncharacterized protein YuzE
MPHAIRITFDREANAAYIYLRDIEPGGAVETVTVENGPGLINLDFDKDQRLIGVEVLAATQHLPKELLEQAERL